MGIMNETLPRHSWVEVVNHKYQIKKVSKSRPFELAQQFFECNVQSQIIYEPKDGGNRLMIFAIVGL